MFPCHQGMSEKCSRLRIYSQIFMVTIKQIPTDNSLTASTNVISMQFPNTIPNTEMTLPQLVGPIDVVSPEHSSGDRSHEFHIASSKNVSIKFYKAEYARPTKAELAHCTTSARLSKYAQSQKLSSLTSHKYWIFPHMVTEVDRYGVHRNRQPEFFNGIIGHIRADQNGWIYGNEPPTNYWRRHFQIPEVHHGGNWYHYPQESNNANQAGESQESLPGSDMEDTDSLIVHAEAASAPSQIHQLATVLWNILNNDREANLAILEKLKNPRTDPIQVFSAANRGAFRHQRLSLTTPGWRCSEQLG